MQKDHGWQPVRPSPSASPFVRSAAGTSRQGQHTPPFLPEPARVGAGAAGMWPVETGRWTPSFVVSLYFMYRSKCFGCIAACSCMHPWLHGSMHACMPHGLILGVCGLNFWSWGLLLLSAACSTASNLVAALHSSLSVCGKEWIPGLETADSFVWLYLMGVSGSISQITIVLYLTYPTSLSR